MKLQVLNLAVKLYLTNAEQTELLCQYLFSLARYDENYDIRDRARFLKPFVFPTNEKPTILSRNAKKIFLAPKPAPLLESKYKGREQFQLGSLSHYLNIKANGYHDLPPFPKKAPDSSVRGVEISVNDNGNNVEHNDNNSDYIGKHAKGSNKSNKKDESFYSNDENESSNDGSSSDSDESSSEESSETEEGGDSTDEDESDENDSSSADSSSDSDSSEESSSSDNEASSSSSSEPEPEVKKQNHKISKQTNNTSKPKAAPQPASKSERSNLDLLLELDDISPAGPIMTPSLGGFLTPSVSQPLVSSNNRFELVGPNFISMEKRELLNKTINHGLQIDYRFTRAPHLFSAKMISLELTFRNDSHNELENIHVSDKSSLPPGVLLNEFAPIAKLTPGQSAQGILGIDFNDSTQSLTFKVASSAGSATVSMKSTVGELIRAVRLTEKVFKEEQSQLRGMNEHSASFDTKYELKAVQKRIFETANLALISKSDCDGKDIILFAGQTMASQSLVLVTVELSATDKLAITVNCEKMVVGSMLLNEIKNFIKT